MKRTLQMIFITLMVSVFVSSAYAEFTVKSYKQMKEDKTGKVMLSWYIGGLGEGISWANAAMKREKGKELYCAPPKFAVRPDNYVSILEGEIKRQEEITGFKETQEGSIGMFLLLGLENVFPCDKPK